MKEKRKERNFCQDWMPELLLSLLMMALPRDRKAINNNR